MRFTPKNNRHTRSPGPLESLATSFFLSWMKRSVAIRWLSVIVCFLALEGVRDLTAATLPAGFAESVVTGPAGGWDNAVGVAFENNGRMYVWERTGRGLVKGPARPNQNLVARINGGGRAGGGYRHVRVCV